MISFLTTTFIGLKYITSKLGLRAHTYQKKVLIYKENDQEVKSIKYR